MFSVSVFRYYWLLILSYQISWIRILCTMNEERSLLQLRRRNRTQVLHYTRLSFSSHLFSPSLSSLVSLHWFGIQWNYIQSLTNFKTDLFPDRLQMGHCWIYYEMHMSSLRIVILNFPWLVHRYIIFYMTCFNYYCYFRPMKICESYQ